MTISPWIYAARPITLVASIIPIVSAILILPKHINFKLNIFLWTLIAAIIIQIVTNYINDLYDFLKGADENRLGPKRMLQSRSISPLKMKKVIAALTCIGIISGIPLVIQGGSSIIFIGLSSFILAYLYTGGPFPLAYNGLGDIFVFIYFGIIAVLGTYYLQTGHIDVGATYLAISIGAKNVLLLIINNIRDYKTDKLVHKNTLIVIFGLYFGKFQALLMLITSYVAIYKLALNIQSINIFYIALFSIPLSINILCDTLLKKDSQLNITLGKISSLLILDCALLAIGINI